MTSMEPKMVAECGWPCSWQGSLTGDDGSQESGCEVLSHVARLRTKDAQQSPSQLLTSPGSHNDSHKSTHQIGPNHVSKSPDALTVRRSRSRRTQAASHKPSFLQIPTSFQTDCPAAGGSGPEAGEQLQERAAAGQCSARDQGRDGEVSPEQALQSQCTTGPTRPPHSDESEPSEGKLQREHLTKAEYEARREKNRIAARKCRARKVAYVRSMDSRIKDKTLENETLRLHVVSLQRMYNREVKLKEALKAIIRACWPPCGASCLPGYSADRVIVALESGEININTLLTAMTSPSSSSAVSSQYRVPLTLKSPASHQLPQQHYSPAALPGQPYAPDWSMEVQGERVLGSPACPPAANGIEYTADLTPHKMPVTTGIGGPECIVNQGSHQKARPAPKEAAKRTEPATPKKKKTSKAAKARQSEPAKASDLQGAGSAAISDPRTPCQQRSAQKQVMPGRLTDPGPNTQDIEYNPMMDSDCRAIFTNQSLPGPKVPYTGSVAPEPAVMNTYLNQGLNPNINLCCQPEMYGGPGNPGFGGYGSDWVQPCGGMEGVYGGSVDTEVKGYPDWRLCMGEYQPPSAEGYLPSLVNCTSLGRARSEAMLEELLSSLLAGSVEDPADTQRAMSGVLSGVLPQVPCCLESRVNSYSLHPFPYRQASGVGIGGPEHMNPCSEPVIMDADTDEPVGPPQPWRGSEMNGHLLCQDTVYADNRLEGEWSINPWETQRGLGNGQCYRAGLQGLKPEGEWTADPYDSQKEGEDPQACYIGHPCQRVEGEWAGKKVEGEWPPCQRVEGEWTNAVLDRNVCPKDAVEQTTRAFSCADEELWTSFGMQIGLHEDAAGAYVLDSDIREYATRKSRALSGCTDTDQ